MTGKTFVDTNVLLYSIDVDAGAKYATARRVLAELWSERSGTLSTQVLQEFYVNATGKIAQPLPKAVARRVVESYAPWSVQITSEEIRTAFLVEDEAKIGFWDALLLATAIRSGATRILSEDLNAGQMIAGIRIVNPFR